MKVNVYIGYDGREDENKKFPDIVNPPYSVARYSILKNYKGGTSWIIPVPFIIT